MLQCEIVPFADKYWIFQYVQVHEIEKNLTLWSIKSNDRMSCRMKYSKSVKLKHKFLM